MELVKLLLKLLYLALLFVFLHLIIKPRVQLTGAKLTVLVLTTAILIMYFTFDSGYNFITNNEIVIKAGEKDEDVSTEEDNVVEEETSKNGSSKTEIVNKVHEESSSNYLLDHTHKFVQNKVFGQ